MQETAKTSFFELVDALEGISPGATLVSGVALLILILWETKLFKRSNLLQLIPGPLVAVVWGVTYNSLAVQFIPEWMISQKHLVSLPELAH